jgi:ribulose-bisphosphate carboxylase large chain
VSTDGAERIRARYLIETPHDPAAVAEVMAGEQSCGTFTRVEGETDALRAARARHGRGRSPSWNPASAPACPTPCSNAKGDTGPWRRAHVRHLVSGRQHRRQPADARGHRVGQPVRPRAK